MTKYKDWKFLINDDKELAEAIQSQLFAMGYKWSCLGKSIQYFDNTYSLHTDILGNIYYDTSHEGYKNFNSTIMTLDDLIVLTKKEAEYELTLGQAIDLALQGIPTEPENDNQIYLGFVANSIYTIFKSDNIIHSTILYERFKEVKFKEYKPETYKV